MQRDDAYLLDILIASRKAIKYLEDLPWKQFIISELHQDAVVRSLEIIGEAARLVSTPTREAYPEIPWEKMIGLRNRLIHEYFRIDLTTIWDTVHDDLPDLVRMMESLIPSDDGV